MTKKTNYRISVPRLLSPIALSIMLVACTSTQQKSSVLDITQAPTLVAQEYLLKADSSQGSEQNNWLVMALKAAVANGQYTQANNIAIRLDKKQLTYQQSAELQLAKARIAIAGQDSKAALRALVFEPWWKLNDTQWLAYHQLRAGLFEQNQDWLSAARENVALFELSEKDERQRLADSIWQDLNQYSDTQITELEVKSNEVVLEGWLQLAIYNKTLAVHIGQLKNTLEKWLEANPRHPAATYLPQDLQAILALEITRPTHTALLLPLSGKFAAQAQLIRDGFIFAQMRAAQESDIAALDIIDTDSKANDAMADYLIDNQVDMIVGPLLKSNVSELQQALDNKQSDIPMLALNIPDTINTTANRCYFALSPEQESAQAAQHLAQLGYHYPLILAPEGRYGERVVEAFKAAWQEKQTTPVSVDMFADKTKLQRGIEEVFGLETSQQNIAQITRLTGLKLETEPRSRRDIDAVYIVASNAELTLIKPFIEVAVNPDATPPALFASSRSHNTAGQVEDLTGISYSDIPLLISPNPEISDELKSIWPDASNAELRLKAMGMDAYSLMMDLNKMRAFGESINGQTGLLSIDDQCVVQRELSWQDGR